VAVKRLGKYEIVGRLGEGATSYVLRARDTVLGRDVAIKMLKPALVADRTAFLRFAREARAAALLFHPHIALVLDMDSVDDRHFIVMRYVPGRALDRLLADEGPLPWAEVRRLAAQVGGALAFAHDRGFIHRDVKPANIIRTPDDDFVLTDFGLTRAMMSTGLTSHTGAALGTAAYMPPEVWHGRAATPATDEYALACVLVEALTGDVLFAGETPPEIMTRHVLTGAELPDVWPEGVPKRAGDVFARALAKAPDERHGGPRALVAALTASARGESSLGMVAGSTVALSASTVQPPPTGDEDEWVVELAPGVEMVFVRVPAGEFLMGAGPAQPVDVDEYWIGKYPVTNRQYAAFVKAIGYELPEHWDLVKEVKDVSVEQPDAKKGLVDRLFGSTSKPKVAQQEVEYIRIPFSQEQHPVVNVTWEDAMRFCKWAARVTGQSITLPTEAQWEKAARGTDGRKYPWGEEKPTPGLCNFDENVEGTTPVGMYSPAGDSPYGCADMAGNVREWVLARGVLRGGSWNKGNARGANRYRNDPISTNDYYGFRCVVSAAPGL
jgi:serine/threonine-protein kinase